MHDTWSIWEWSDAKCAISTGIRHELFCDQRRHKKLLKTISLLQHYSLDDLSKFGISPFAKIPLRLFLTFIFR
ncbi:unnamed protein product [Gongylonema pulchrum]|uniref:SAM domain-containing protein n=1 Tax=Gongylonema pulchrum TaxID=637853 RepID=A0A183EGK2_9BILA|nr:unnamed protein product [Gongylonema pulchrum]